MRFISWNVNGIRAVLQKGFLEFVKNVNPDILCIQETKSQPTQVNLPLNGYFPYWSSAERKGYSGTLTLSKMKAKEVNLGIGINEHDREGRVITLEFSDYFVVNVYTPNAQRGLGRLEYRMKWDLDFLNYLIEIRAKKPVIFCGDLNVAHKEIDLANPKSNRKNAGFTNEERDGFQNIIKAGFIDTFREFTPEGGHYTWWSYWRDARQRNIGWRIDYFGISSELRPHLKKSYIMPEVMGSDHCPIGMDLE